jgi:hypothetical protein
MRAFHLPNFFWLLQAFAHLLFILLLVYEVYGFSRIL